MKKNSGFTLLELIMVMALIAVVMSFAIPSMQSFTQNNRLTTNINVLIGHLAYERAKERGVGTWLPYYASPRE